jgi:hypothetical protein
MAMSVSAQSRSKPGSVRGQDWCPAQLRAMALWPRLSRRTVAKCGCDASRIAHYISRRTRIPAEAIEALLEKS